MLCRQTPRPHPSGRVEKEAAIPAPSLVMPPAFFERVSALHGITICEGQLFKLTGAVRDTPPLALGLLLQNAEPLVYFKQGTTANLAEMLKPILNEAGGPVSVLGMRVHRQLWCSFSFPAELLESNQCGTSPYVKRDGEIVSSCTSCRENAFMAEAFVKTALSHQGYGYGTRVTLAWAREVHNSGRTPVFSCRSDNLRSLRIASRLGLTLEFRELRLLAEECGRHER